MTSDGIPGQAPGDSRRWGRLAIACAACALVIGIYAASANPGMRELIGENAGENYYNLLARGFRNGQLNLEYELPPQLSQVASAYDLTRERLDQAPAGRLVWDLSYYKGKLFLYFGVTPALLLFWPYAALTGHYFPHKNAVILFLAMGFLIGASLLWSLWRRCFQQVGVGVVFAAMLALGLANFAPVVLQRSAVYEVAISCGYALTMLSLAGVWLALLRPHQRCRWLAAASLAYGLAVGARPSLLPGAVMLLAPVLMAVRRTDTSDRSDQSDTPTLDCADMSALSKRRQVAALQSRRSAPPTAQDSLAAIAPSATAARRPVWQLALAAFGPIALIGIGLMLYNYLRFDNPLECGQACQIPATRGHRQFSLSFFWFNFQVGFLAPARWHAHLPIIGQIVRPALPKDCSGVEYYAFGLLTNVPLVWLALAAPLALLRRSLGDLGVLRCFLVCVAALFAGTAAPLFLHDSMTVRYEFEFAHILVLLAVLGVLAIERATARAGVRRLIGRCGWGLLLVFSVGFNLLADFQRHSEAHFNLATALMQKEGLSEAEHNGLGSALARKQRVTEAMAEYQKALSLDPDYAEAHYNFGNALLRSGRPREAIGEYQAALAKQPDDAKALNNFGNALVQSGRVEEGIHQYRKALASQPDNVMARQDLAGVLAEQGKLQEAREYYETALRIAPDDASAHNGLGGILFQQGRLEDAMSHWSKAVQLQPGLMEAHNNLASALVMKGRAREAVAEFNEALRLDPDNVAIQNNLAWLLAASPDGSVRDGARAAELAQRANQLASGKDPVVLGTLAAALAEQGSFAEALATGQRALELAAAQSNSVVARNLRGQIELYKAGLPCRDAGATRGSASTNATTGRKN